MAYMVLRTFLFREDTGTRENLLSIQSLSEPEPEFVWSGSRRRKYQKWAAPATLEKV